MQPQRGVDKAHFCDVTRPLWTEPSRELSIVRTCCAIALLSFESPLSATVSLTSNGYTILALEVSGTTVTRDEARLAASLLTMITGRVLRISEPRVGSSAAKKNSPRFIIKPVGRAAREFGRDQAVFNFNEPVPDNRIG